MKSKKPTPDHHVAVHLSLEIPGGRPPGMSADDHITSILCSIINGVMEQAVVFLDKNPQVTEVYNKDQLRSHIMNGAIIASVEQLCAAWKVSHRAEDLPDFVKTMFVLFEASAEADQNPKNRPTVGDVGHA